MIAGWDIGGAHLKCAAQGARTRRVRFGGQGGGRAIALGRDGAISHETSLETRAIGDQGHDLLRDPVER
jgi:hypothetical protein